MELSSWIEKEKNRLDKFSIWWEGILKEEASANVFSMDSSPIFWHEQYKMWKGETYLEEDRRIEDEEIGVPANGLYGNIYHNRRS